MMFALKLVEPIPAQDQQGSGAKEIEPKAAAQGGERLLHFWVASLPEEAADVSLPELPAASLSERSETAQPEEMISKSF